MTKKENNQIASVPQTAQGGKKRRTAGSIISDVLFYLLMLLMLGGSLLFVMSKQTEKSFFGYRFYTVLTTSMEPAYSPGDMVFVRVCDIEDIKTGDVITFNPDLNSPGTYLTHRAVEKIPSYNGTGELRFKTKGDNNDINDPFAISDTNLIGKVVLTIPKAGTAMTVIKQNLLLYVLVVVLLFALYMVVHNYFKSSKAAKNSSKADTRSDAHTDTHTDTH